MLKQHVHEAIDERTAEIIAQEHGAMARPWCLANAALLEDEGAHESAARWRKLAALLTEPDENAEPAAADIGLARKSSRGAQPRSG